jgi:hypothetical protein
MNAEGVELAEQIKWWDALDELLVRTSDAHIEKGLQMARECRHPDAQWLAALFPAGTAVTMQRLYAVMLEQGEDARALCLGVADGGWGEMGPVASRR